MTDWTPDYWSWLEKRFGQLLGDWKIKGVKHNHQAEGMDGRTYYIDFAFPDIKLAIECDSALYHSKSFQKRRDKMRQTTLEEAGWHFVRFTGDDILHNQTDVKRKLLKAMAETRKNKQVLMLALSKSVRVR